MEKIPCVLIFLHLFKFLCDPVSIAKAGGLLHFKLIIHGFKPLLELSPFLNRFFLVIPNNLESHVTIYDIGTGMKGRCTYMFPEYWNEIRFLLGISSFAYSEKDLYENVQHQKGQLVKFINNMGYLGGITSMAKADKKGLKCFIDILLLIRARSREERRIIFGKL